MLVARVDNIGHSGEILPYELAQYAVALAVEYAHTTHTDKYGIINEILHLIDCFVATKPPHVEVLLECASVCVNRGACHAALGRRIYGLRTLSLRGECRRVGVFEALEAQLGAHTSEKGHCRRAINALQGAHRGLSFYADGVARLQRHTFFQLLLRTLQSVGSLLLLLRTLFASFLAPLLALGNLLQLALEVVVAHQSAVRRFHLLLIVTQLLAYSLGVLALGLCLAYLLYGVFYATVGFVQEVLSLFFCTRQNFFAALFNLSKPAFIPLDSPLYFFLTLMNCLPLGLPIAFVAHDVLQVLVALYVIGTHKLAGFADNLLGQARLAGYLNGKRAARSAYGELEQGAHLAAVVEHRPVNNAGSFLCKMLQVLIVGSYHGPCLAAAELVEHALGNRSAYLRLGAGAELVDEQQRAFAGMTHHLLHVGQMR